MLEFTSAAQMREHYKAVRARTRFMQIPELPPPPPLEPERPKQHWFAPRIEPILSPRELALIAILREGPAGKTIPRAFPPIPRIQRVVREFYGVSHADLVSARRTKDVVRIRQIAIYLCRVLTPVSMPIIGKHFGDRDHTTVLHAFRKIGDLVRADAGFAAEINELQRALAL